MVAESKPMKSVELTSWIYALLLPPLEKVRENTISQIDDDETHLSAIKTLPKKSARVPRSYENEGRT